MIKKISLCWIAIMAVVNSQAQPNQIPDSVIIEICTAIKENKSTDDSVRVFSAFERHLFPILRVLDDSTGTEAFKYTYYRLQKLCPEFEKIINQETHNDNGEWARYATEPPGKMTKEECDEVFRKKHFYYVEYSDNTDTVKLTLTNDQWTDTFRNGTYSKLSLKRTSESEFVVTFIESNNEMRKSYSKPGEKYYYRLIEKHPGYYIVCYEKKESNTFITFKIHSL